jgi:hypothetical protein
VLQELQKFVQERWQRVFQRTTIPGGAWLHAPPLMPETGGSALLFPSLPFPAGSEGHHYLQNNQNATQAVDFSFHFLCFSNLLRFLPFLKSVPFLCLLCRSVIFFFFRWQIRCGGPNVVGEEAASLLWERDAAARLAEFAAGGRSAG